ncbi:MAG: metallophosphoesterase family protein [Actinobacteria bacterium]|nr:metallophosphoesterase family protein [Actinomycetota bacterium]
MDREIAGRAVVMSDTHFGDGAAVLTRGEVVEAFLRELDGLGEIDLLVLLGDVWDLWRTRLSAAAAAGAGFFRALAAWGGAKELVLVCGNHDHHVWSFHEEAWERREAGWEESGELSLVLGPCRAWEEPVYAVEGLPLWMSYPFLTLRVGMRSVLLTHGHHLDFFSRSFWWAKTAWLARFILKGTPGIALSDIDRLNKPFFELLACTSRVPEITSWEYRLYGVLRLFARLLRFQTGKGASPRRFTSIEENASEVRDLLLHLLPGYIPDLFVFGHTHRAGLGETGVGSVRVRVANTGCWLDDGEGGTGMTYLVIDGGVRLRRLGGGEVARELG